MNRVILLICIFLALNIDLSSKTYYFSSSIGNDEYSSDQAQNQSTPWKTIDKLNSAMDIIYPGDSILFKRDDVFTGSIVLTRSGDQNKNIVFGSYSEGSLPIISGVHSLFNWINEESNIWTADCPGNISSIVDFFIDGVSQQIGRFPNIVDADNGYLKIESPDGNISISNSKLNDSDNWTGADAIIRTRNWVLDRLEIETHIGERLEFQESAHHEFRENYGFFIQNHKETLDVEGEWYFDFENQKMLLYLESDPNNMDAKCSSYESIFETTGQSFFVIENLEFFGSAYSSLWLKQCSKAIIRNVKISRSGNYGIRIVDCNDVSFLDNVISEANNSPLVLLRGDNVSIRRNKLLCSGLRAGMGHPSSGLLYTGMYLDGDNVVCDANILDSIGYSGISFHGDHYLIKNNHINHFCLLKSDGGGIYTAGIGGVENIDRIIQNNIVSNGFGEAKGTPYPSINLAHGIYLDDWTNNTIVMGNTVNSCSKFGIYVHNSHSSSILGNTVYDNEAQLAFVQNTLDPNSPIRNCLVLENVLFSKSESQLVTYFETSKDDIPLFGNINNNYYCRPLNEDKIIRVITNTESTSTSNFLNLEEWKRTFEYDQNSFSTPIEIPSFEIIDLLSPNMIANGTFESDISGWVCWSLNGNCMISWQQVEKLDEGSLELSFSESSGTPDGSLISYVNIGEVIAGEPYLLKLSNVSSQEDRRISIALRRSTPKYTYFSPWYSLVTNTDRTEHEIVIIPDSSETSAQLVFLMDEDGTKQWIDNIELYHVEVEPVPIGEYVLFDSNPTQHEKINNDDRYFIDVRGNKYHNYRLQPYSSLILLAISEESYENDTFIENEHFLLVYPNPAMDYINLMTNDFSEKSLSIIDMSGRIVLRRDSVFETLLSVNVSQFSGGTYLVRFIGENGILTSMIIVE